ncbi:MAG: 2-hydroxyacid dehydrogenase, partial [Candidatus Nanopelagicales bacterium]
TLPESVERLPRIGARAALARGRATDGTRSGTFEDVLTMTPADIRDGLPADLAERVLTWDSGDPVPERSAEVTLWVPPYTSTAADLALMARLPGLQSVQALTAGVDAHLPHLPEGVTLCNAAGVHDASTAELAVGLALASLRHLDEFARAMPAGRWAYDRHESLADKRVLIVGFGAIGQAIARRLEGFECEVTAVARTARAVGAITVHPVPELPSLLPTVDVVILIVPLTEATRGLVDAAFLGRMRDGALLVNMSRGPIVATDALGAECASGRLRAALDVTDPEPLPAEHPLWRTPGVLISPHVGGNTSAFLPRARRLVADQIRRRDAGEPLANVVVPGAPLR